MTASTGNHGSATAWAAQRLGLRAVVYAPRGCQPHEARSDARARRRGTARGRRRRRFEGSRSRVGRRTSTCPSSKTVPSPRSLTGMRRSPPRCSSSFPKPPAAVVVPVGNGALLAGIGRALGELAPSTLRVGVAAREAPVMVESWRAERPVAERQLGDVRRRPGGARGDPVRGRRAPDGRRPHAAGLGAGARPSRRLVLGDRSPRRGRRGSRVGRARPTRDVSAAPSCSWSPGATSTTLYSNARSRIPTGSPTEQSATAGDTLGDA